MRFEIDWAPVVAGFAVIVAVRAYWLQRRQMAASRPRLDAGFNAFSRSTRGTRTAHFMVVGRNAPSILRSVAVTLWWESRRKKRFDVREADGTEVGDSPQFFRFDLPDEETPTAWAMTIRFTDPGEATKWTLKIGKTSFPVSR